jgi:ATP-dependent exoDNAse (exonuclease V) alpha subunit
MAIYHLSMKPVSREKGRSATAAAAYRAAARIHDLRTGEVWDFTRRRGVEHAEIVLPGSARGDASWARDREALWNAAEAGEKRKDSRTAREYELALPHEFTRRQQIDLVRRFSLELADRYGVAVDFAIHLPHWHGDERNVHAHVMTTTRAINAAGLGAKATMEWSNTDLAKKGFGSTKHQLTSIRGFWSDLQNEKFRELGLDTRVDHRTLKAQGIEREPTTHLGPAVSGMHRRGMDTNVGRRIAQEQRRAAELRIHRLAQIRQLERERSHVEQSIVDVSGDLAAAQRDLLIHRPSLEDIRRQAREEWLKLRAERLAQEQSPAAAEKTPEKTPKPDVMLTLEERQRQSAERWLAHREAQKNQPDQAKNLEQEQDLDRSQDLGHGIDDDFGL